MNAGRLQMADEHLLEGTEKQTSSLTERQGGSAVLMSQYVAIANSNEHTDLTV